MGWDSERLSNSPEVTKLVKVALGEYEAPGSHLCPPPRPQCKTGKKRVRRLGALKGRLREISLKSKHQSLWGLERTDQHGCEASRAGTALASVFTLPVTRYNNEDQQGPILMEQVNREARRFQVMNAIKKETRGTS